MPTDASEPLLGAPLPAWTARPVPSAAVLTGRYCRLERLDPERHAADLFAADQLDVTGVSWAYLPYGPFVDIATYRAWVEQAAASSDPIFYTVIDTDPSESAAHEHAVGVLSYLRVQPEMGSVEVGHVHFSPLLQRRRASTEAQFLLMRYAFDDLGYRRYEWKCNALNAASQTAAVRLGFSYEGTFRQASVVKGRNRDTAWYSVIDPEWPVVRARFDAWLAPGNFDDQGRQRAGLGRAAAPDDLGR